MRCSTEIDRNSSFIFSEGNKRLYMPPVITIHCSEEAEKENKKNERNQNRNGTYHILCESIQVYPP